MEKEAKQQVSEMIRVAREKKGISQSDLANILGVTRATVNGYESGRTSPTVTTLQRIANALGTTINIFFGD